jgi:nucleotide-binding universal stress UspA family protein
MPTFRRILHASDFSTASRGAFRKAVELAKDGRGPLLIAHVLPILPIMADTYVAATAYEELMRGQRAAAKKQLDRLVAKARAAKVRASGILLDFGVPAERIVRLARAKRADLIVMGTHGRTGFKRAILGSVAGRVVALATCPVLTVRAR